jgi:hypothetical protein
MSKLIKAKYSCHLGKKAPVGRLSEVSEAEAKRRGLMKVNRYIEIDRRRGHWSHVDVWVEPACAGLETTDPEVYVAHMLEHHGKKPTVNVWPSDSNLDLFRRADGKRRGPRLTADGTSLKTSESTSMIGEIRSCPRCGLIAEVGLFSAQLLWWTEHLELCVGDQASEAGAA